MKEQINIEKFNPDKPPQGIDLDTVKAMGMPTEFPVYDQDQHGNTRYPCKDWILTGPKEPLQDENLIMTPYKGKHFNDLIEQIRND